MDLVHIQQWMLWTDTHIIYNVRNKRQHIFKHLGEKKNISNLYKTQNETITICTSTSLCSSI